MGKDFESLKQSDTDRAGVIAKYGLIPTSILKYDMSDRSIDIMVEEEGRDYFAESDKSNLETLKKSGNLDDKLFKRVRTSSMGCGSGGLSRFPQNVGRIFVKLYTEENDTVFDPFAGHNSRMQLVFEQNRNYVGRDLSHKFMEANYKIREMLYGNRGQSKLFVSSNTIELTEGDSRKIDNVADESADFIITSPPYYDIEYYGDEPEQLSECKTYQQFLDDMQLVVNECFRILKKGKFIVFCINDFRRNGEFISYHSDIINLFRKAGFKIWDTVITDLTEHPIGAIFASQIDKYKIIPKRHEYSIVGRKI
jgi:DNA modification methylase